MTSRLKETYRSGGMRAVRALWHEQKMAGQMPSEAELSKPGPLNSKPNKTRPGRRHK